MITRVFLIDVNVKRLSESNCICLLKKKKKVVENSTDFGQDFLLIITILRNKGRGAKVKIAGHI